VRLIAPVVRRVSGLPLGPVNETLALFETDGLGFLGASREDQDRWLAGFRALLDGLAGPIQVVIEFQPGELDEAELLDGESAPPPPAGAAAMLRADTAFVEKIANWRSSRSREVTVVVAGEEAETTRRALTAIGVRVSDREKAAPGSGTESRPDYRDAEGWHRTWYLERFPGGELEPGWLLRLVPPDRRAALAWHARPLPTDLAVSYLQRQLNNMRTSQVEVARRGATDPVLAGAVPAAQELQRRLVASRDRAFQVAVYLTITARTREELAGATGDVEAAARGALCTLRLCHYRQADGRLATLPAGNDGLGRSRVVDTTALLTFLPWLDAELADANGLVLGRTRATGMPVQVDPFDDVRYENANIAVFGHSGAGKTYLLSSLLLGAVARGAQAFVIDPEHEYGRLARAVNGVDVPLALGSGHALNVLEPKPPGAEESWLGPAVADALDLVNVICGSLDEVERALTEAAIRDAYSAADHPVLRDVAAHLPPSSRPARILQRWVGGSLGAMFSSPTNVDLDAPLVVFGMRELREEMVGAVHYLLAEALWSRIKDRRRRCLLVVDELGILFEDATMRRFVVRLARRIRKYNGSLVFATQNPGDLLATEQGTVVATNPAIRFLGAQRPTEAQKLQRAFQLSDSQRQALEAARRGDFLVAAGPERVAFRVIVPPWQAALIRTV